MSCSLVQLLHLCLWITVMQCARGYTTIRESLPGTLLEDIDEYRSGVRYITPLAYLMKKERFLSNKDLTDSQSERFIPRSEKTTSGLELVKQCLQTLRQERANINRLPTRFRLSSHQQNTRKPYFGDFETGLPVSQRRHQSHTNLLLDQLAGARNDLVMTQKRQSSFSAPSREWCRMLGRNVCQRSVQQ